MLWNRNKKSHKEQSRWEPICNIKENTEDNGDIFILITARQCILWHKMEWVIILGYLCVLGYKTAVNLCAVWVSTSPIPLLLRRVTKRSASEKVSSTNDMVKLVHSLSATTMDWLMFPYKFIYWNLNSISHPFDYIWRQDTWEVIRVR